MIKIKRYKEYKESYGYSDTTLRTINVYIKKHRDDINRIKSEVITKDDLDANRDDFIIGEYDKETPEKEDSNIIEPSMKKGVSLGYGKTNMN